MTNQLPAAVERAARAWCEFTNVKFDDLGPIGRARILEDMGVVLDAAAEPDAGSGGDARFYAHPSGDGAICRSGSTTRLCLDELLAALNSVAARQPVGVEPIAFGPDDMVGVMAHYGAAPAYGQPQEFFTTPLYMGAPPAPAAVPVDETKRKDLIYRLHMARDMQRAGGWSYLFAEAADALEATHPQPAAAKDGE